MKQKWLLTTEICSEEILISALPEKCIRQPVLIAVLKPKCLSNLIQKDRFTAENVFLTTGRPGKTVDTKPEFRFGNTIFVSVELWLDDTRSASLKRTYVFAFFEYFIIKNYFFYPPRYYRFIRSPPQGLMIKVMFFLLGTAFLIESD